jgi:hypothetical protein
VTANVKKMGDSISLGYHHSFTKDIALAVVLDQQVTKILKAIKPQIFRPKILDHAHQPSTIVSKGGAKETSP